MKHLLILVAIAFVIASCENNKQVQGESDAKDTTVMRTPVDLTDSIISGCYSYINNKDTSSAQLQIKNSMVTGSLTYNFFEKDYNDGTFEGELRQDTIIGWYLYRSEGIMSVRQVAWIYRNSQLWPAVGEVVVRNDSMLFKDPAYLVFDSIKIFVKTECVI